ncbi:hypothetical protein [Mesorhizobium sp. M0959]|uniref:hypothetical protein n=1 Tax=unclassified Mesorhizobium TaxID=325217 RepID=UPI003334BCEE
MKTAIFVAIGAGPLDRVELDETAVLADLLHLLKQRGVDVEEFLIFMEDHDEPLEHYHPLHGHDHPIFHAHRCKKVEITVHYKTDAFKHKFAPSATIAKVTRWAVEKVGLGKEEAEEHVLHIHASQLQPPSNAHLGSYATDSCAVVFDLVRKKLVQG